MCLDEFATRSDFASHESTEDEICALGIVHLLIILSLLVFVVFTVVIVHPFLLLCVFCFLHRLILLLAIRSA